jgi:voltage-gated potassium channel
MQLKDIWKIFSKNLLITELVLVWLIIIWWAFTFHFVEWWRILDSFYFIVSTMSTIGLWDFLPQTDLGKWFFIFYAIIGVPFFVSIWGLILENRFRKSIEHYLKKVYRDIRDAEVEIQQVEETIIRKLKRNLENTQETVENIQEEIQETQKRSRWKKIFKR